MGKSRYPNGLNAATLDVAGAITAASVAATGAVSGASVAATGTVTGASAAFTGTASVGSLTAGVTALEKADSYALAAAEKTLFVGVTLTAGSKVVTLGLAAGQMAFVTNTGPTNAFTVKNVAGDTGTSLAAGKSLLIVGSATANASRVITLD